MPSERWGSMRDEASRLSTMRRGSSPLIPSGGLRRPTALDALEVPLSAGSRRSSLPSPLVSRPDANGTPKTPAPTPQLSAISGAAPDLHLGMPWRQRVTELQDDIVLALASATSPAMVEEKRNNARARRFMRQQFLSRGWQRFSTNALASPVSTSHRVKKFMRKHAISLGLQAFVGNQRAAPMAVDQRATRFLRRHYCRLLFRAVAHAATMAPLPPELLATALKTMHRYYTRRAYRAWRYNTLDTTSRPLFKERKLWYAFGLIRAAAGRRVEVKALLHRSGSALQLRGQRRVWSTWAAQAEVLHEVRRRAGVAVRAWRGHCLLGAWLLLLAAFDRRRRFRGATMSLRHSYAKRALNTWQEAAAERHVWMQRTRRVLGALMPELRGKRRALLSLQFAASVGFRRSRAAAGFRDGKRLRAMNTWKRVAAVEGRKERLRRQAVAALMSVGRRRALTTWVHYCEAREEMMRLRRLGLAAIVHKESRRAFSTWLENARDEAKRLKLRGRALDPELRAMDRAFLSLCDAAERQRMRVRAASGLLHHHQLRAMNTWKETAAWHARRATLARRGVSALLRRGMRLAFNSWTSAAEEHSTAVRRLGVALGEWQGANLRRAWLTWLDGHVAVYRLRGVVMSIRNRYTRRALNSWAAACDDLARWEQRMQKAASVFVPELRSVRRALNAIFDAAERREHLRRASVGIVDGQRFRAFNAWAENAASSSRRSMLRTRGITALTMTCERRAYNGWAAFADERARRTRGLRGAIVALVDRDFYRAYATWRAFVVAGRRARKLLRRGGASLVRNGEHRALNKWFTYVLELRPQWLLLRRGAAAVVMLEARVAYNTWTSFNELHANRSNASVTAIRAFGLDARLVRRAFNKLCDAQREFQRRLRAAAGFTHGSESRAWRAWIEAWTTRRAKLQLLHRGGAAMLSADRRRALNTWSVYVEARSEVMRKLRLGVMAVVHRELRRTLSEWQWHAVGHSREATLLRRGATALTSRSVRLAYNAWEAHTSEASHQMQLLLKGAGALTSRSSFRAFGAWAECASERAMQMRMLTKGGAALMHRDKRRALSSWAHWAHDEATMLKRLKRGLDPRLRLMSRAFLSLCDAAERQRMRVRAMAGFHDGLRLRAMNTWKDVAEARARAEGLLHRGLSALAMRGIRLALNGWLELAEERATTMRRLGVALGEWQGANLRRAWLTWLDGFHTYYRLRGVVMSLKGRHARRALNHWSAVHNTLQKNDHRMRRALLCAVDSKHRYVRRLWRRWSRLSAIGVCIRRATGKLFAGEGRRKLKNAFMDWAFRALRRAAALRERTALVKAPSPDRGTQTEEAAPKLELVRARPRPQTAPVIHVVHHHRGLPQPRPKKTPKAKTWSTAASRAKAWRGPSVPLDLGSAYFHQLEESQMAAAVKWRKGKHAQGQVPPPLSRALEAADAFNRYFDGELRASGSPPLHHHQPHHPSAASGASSAGQPPSVRDGMRDWVEQDFYQPEEEEEYLEGYDIDEGPYGEAPRDEAEPWGWMSGRQPASYATPSSSGLHAMPDVTPTPVRGAVPGYATPCSGSPVSSAQVPLHFFSPARYRREPIVE